MAQEKLYELLKDYEHPFVTVHKGYIKTEKEWMRIIPMLRLGDCKALDGWFREVQHPIFSMDDLKSFVVYTLNCIEYRFIDSLEMTKVFDEWCKKNKKAVETK